MIRERSAVFLLTTIAFSKKNNERASIQERVKSSGIILEITFENGNSKKCKNLTDKAGFS